MNLNKYILYGRVYLFIYFSVSSPPPFVIFIFQLPLALFFFFLMNSGMSETNNTDATELQRYALLFENAGVC